MKINKEKGFTLIELLVVIAIIGILSTVVLTSLGPAKSKGNNAKIKAQLHGLQIAAELYNDNNNGYGVTTTSCSSGMFSDTGSGMDKYTTSANYPGSPTLTCYSNGSAFNVSVPLSAAEGSSLHWCVDSSGNSKGRASAAPTSGTPGC